MPLVRNNSTWFANMVWKCAKCGREFVFVDEGEKHEKTCNGNARNNEEKSDDNRTVDKAH